MPPIFRFGAKILEYNDSKIHSYVFPAGIYQFECWGGSGGLPTPYLEGSRGSYVSGILRFLSPQTLFFYLGEGGSYIETHIGDVPRTFNGGGSGGIKIEHSAYGGSSGGGGTDIRLINETDTFDGLKSRIIVAGGGGGTIKHGVYTPGGYGGVLFGGNGSYSGNGDGITTAKGGSQIKGGDKGSGPGGTGHDGSFGIGGDWCNTYSSSGGGGGYFGGGGGGISNGNHGSGGGGSSYISGYPGCNSVSINSSESPISFMESPFHYSGYIFKEATIISGNMTMPSPYGSPLIGHIGNGVIRITSIGCGFSTKSADTQFNSFIILLVFIIFPPNHIY